jgi:transposase-like protein
MEEKDILKCPRCNNNCVKKSGHTAKGKQRFYCKNCKKTFTNLSRFKISKNAKLALGLLYNLLDSDFYNTESLQQALHNAILQKKEINLNDVYYDGCLKKHKEHGSHLSYKCYNPKLIVCVENNKLMLYKIHPANKEIKHNYRTIVIHEILHKY